MWHFTVHGCWLTHKTPESGTNDLITQSTASSKSINIFVPVTFATKSYVGWCVGCYTHSGFVSQLRTLRLGKSIIFIANGKQACSVSSQDVTSSLKVAGWINNPEKCWRLAVKASSLSIASKTRRAKEDHLCLFKHRSDNKEEPRKGKKIFPLETSPSSSLKKSVDLPPHLPCSLNSSPLRTLHYFSFCF